MIFKSLFPRATNRAIFTAIQGWTTRALKNTVVISLALALALVVCMLAITGRIERMAKKLFLKQCEKPPVK